MTLKEKISQMFILGFSGTCLNSENTNIQNSVKNGLGGIIFFAKNLTSYEQTRKLAENMQKIAKTPLFIGIDQEGGRVERTGNIKNKKNYLSPGELCAKTDTEFIREQTQIMSEELKYMGVNMNFAPVLDVDTNPNNPIIGIRSFGNTAEKVIKYSEPVYKTFIQNNIIPVGKHFPGHGDTHVDSHIEMPIVDLSIEEIENIHISPFKKAFENGLDAIMIAHVFYKAFNKKTVPASLSPEIISGYLKEKLNFTGLIISDDMIMGGIKNNYDFVEACIKGINAGIDLFIFRNSDEKTLKIIDKLVKSVESGLISEERINSSVEQIIFIKQKYKIMS